MPGCVQFVKSTFAALTIAGTTLAAVSTATLAQQPYPTQRPITIVVPFAAGGPGDIIARLLASSMKSSLNQTLIVENAVGAGGTIGTARVAKADPDGYTILLMHTGIATAPYLYKELPFDPVKDLAPIGLVTDVPMTLVGRLDYPAKDLKELVADLQAKGDKVNFANSGRGSAAHLCGMLFMNAVGKQLTWISYTGGGPVINDLLGGRVDVYCDPATGTTSLIQSGKIKAFAVTTKDRVKTLPDLPTAHEAGLPGFEVTTWYGLYAPAGTPPAIVSALSKSLQDGLKNPDLIKRFADLSMEPVAQNQATPEALKTYLNAELKKWSEAIAKAGVTPQ